MLSGLRPLPRPEANRSHAGFIEIAVRTVKLLPDEIAREKEGRNVVIPCCRVSGNSTAPCRVAPAA
ncbi:MAG: hypothetical protein HPZ91_16215 [Lentisphaeria bacterium]|nr:hypothetical protein [Lentisphaeria bacterium]